MIVKTYVMPHPPIILPEVGRGEEKKIQETIDSMERAAEEIAELAPETIIITSPHAPAFYNGFFMRAGVSISGDLSAFRVSGVRETAEIDTELCAEIFRLSKLPISSSEKYGEKMDHATLIPLRFIHKRYKNFKIVVIGISGLGARKHYELGKTIDKAVRNLKRKAVFIASGDLSHVLKVDGPYGFKREGPEFDKLIIEILSSGKLKELFNISDKLCEKAAQCGLKSFQIMAGALSSYEIESEFYSYEGTFGVGYGIVAFSAREKNDPYIKLAEKTIEEYIRHGIRPELSEDIPKELLENRAGVFVTLHKNGDLRGCIGTIEPVRASIAEEIISNAVSAATEDPRFRPVKESELDEIVISVDVLKPAEKISSISELDPQRYGVIVSRGFRRGLLLPMLEGIDTAEKQVDIARQKAGIYKDEPYELHRFEVIRHE